MLTLLAVLLYGLPIAALVVLSSGLIFVGMRAKTDGQSVRWTGYAFLAAFAVFMVWAIIAGSVAD
jgi:cytochrome b